jgi:hypothetical protein
MRVFTSLDYRTKIMYKGYTVCIETNQEASNEQHL